MLPKLVFTDVDGVLTDGGMYYDQKGNEWKKFNTSDSLGVLLCSVLKIDIVFITGENTNIVERRAEKLKIKHLIQGSRNKLLDAEILCRKLTLQLSDVAYIGDDLIDIPLLTKVGFSAAPSNASGYIKNKVDFITAKAGGDGAFREFIEEILRREGVLEAAIQKVLMEKYAVKNKK
jgi:3-deoxy-D-manno-octulosonate 8-phosphate phosphatase (KDO 8-P phosphatase)